MEPTVGGQSRTGVVVGIDGSQQSRTALTWAADWAAAQGLPLHVVTAQALTIQPNAVALRIRAELQARLVEETACIDVRHPQLPVSLHVMWTSPAAALVELGREAAAIVVGTRGLSGLPGLVLGSVSGGVAGQARCPVVVVPHRPASPADADPVVVGVDGSVQSRAAARFAAAEAARRGVRLIALAAWEPPMMLGVSVLEPGPEPAAMHAEHEELLREVLHEATAPHPGLDVESRVVPGGTVAALAEASRTACLVVVGSRGRGGFAGLVLGSVSRDLLHAARCPVAIVRAADGHRDGPRPEDSAATKQGA